MKNYETMFITAPTVGPEAYERLVTTFEELIGDQGGTLTNTNKWGRRSLAYEIKNFKEGIYTIFDFAAPGELIKELERRMRLNDSVLKYLTVKTERQERLVKKGTAQRLAKQEKGKRRSNRNSSQE